MNRSKLESKIRRYVELSKKFECEPDEVGDNKPDFQEYANGILNISSGASGFTYTGTCGSANATRDLSEQESILKKIVDDSMAECQVVNDWFEYLELQEELGDIK